MSEEQLVARRLLWDACYNARETGGYPTADGGFTRQGVLVRADNLARLTPEGQAALEAYGIRTIIDLRLPPELERDPNPFANREPGTGAPRYYNLPFHDAESDALMEATGSIEAGYIVLLEHNKGLIGAAVKAVAAGLAEGPVLVHCHGGKDRTGLLVALLLSVAGVPPDVIAQDYALSEILLEPSFAEWVAEQTAKQGGPVEKPLWMYSLPETMSGVLAYLENKYGSAEGYLEEAGVTPQEIEAIRSGLT